MDHNPNISNGPQTWYFTKVFRLSLVSTDYRWSYL